MTDKPETEEIDGKTVTARHITDKTVMPLKIPRSESVAKQVYKLAQLGLSRTAISNFIELSPKKLVELYSHELREGQHNMSSRLAQLAFESAESGDSRMIQYLCKVKLGWTETSTIEHTGEVKAVISAKPLSKEEFELKYLKADENSDDE